MRHLKLSISVLLLSAVVLGCAAQKTLIPTGGSRADGTVKLSYQFSSFEVPEVNMAAGLVTAKQRCGAWGYTGAEPFGGQTKICVASSMGSCNMFQVTVEYQCTGNPPASR